MVVDRAAKLEDEGFFHGAIAVAVAVILRRRRAASR